MPGMGVWGVGGRHGLSGGRGRGRPVRDTQLAAFTPPLFLLGPPEWVAWWGGGPRASGGRGGLGAPPRPRWKRLRCYERP